MKISNLLSYIITILFIIIAIALLRSSENETIYKNCDGHIVFSYMNGPICIK